MSPNAPTVLAVTGLKAEARIADGGGVVALAGGGDADRLAQQLQARLDAGARAVMSFGIAGGLAAGLRPGDVVVARDVVEGETHWPSDPDWRRALLLALPQAVCGDLLGVEAAVMDASGKARLQARSGALAVDMESHVAARLAARHGVPFAALRVVADPAERSLPRAALVGMRPDGGTDVPAVLGALLRRPADLPGLIRTAFDAQAAFRSLKGSRNALGDWLGFARPPTAAGTPADGAKPGCETPLSLTPAGRDPA